MNRISKTYRNCTPYTQKSMARKRSIGISLWTKRQTIGQKEAMIPFLQRATPNTRSVARSTYDNVHHGGLISPVLHCRGCIESHGCRGTLKILGLRPSLNFAKLI